MVDKWQFASTILKYWYLVEFLGQDDFPALSRHEKEECRKAREGNSGRKQITVLETAGYSDICSGSAPISQWMKEAGKAYPKHTVAGNSIEVCIGRARRADLAEKLKAVFAPDRKFLEEKHNTVGLIGLRCDLDGCYIPNSLSLSPLAWGTVRLISKSDRENMAQAVSLETYHRDVQKLEAMLLDQEHHGVTLSGDVLKELIHRVYLIHYGQIWERMNDLNWDAALVIRLYQTEEDKAADEELYSESQLSRSFFAEDLQLALERVEQGAFGDSDMEKTLLDYICGPYAEAFPNLNWLDTTGRINVLDWQEAGEQAQLDFLHRQMEICKAPMGKWPSRFRPGFMQQLAINSCWSPDGGNQAVFSVNGPPGTGKTTLLKEVIAGNVVARAYKLAQYEKPNDAFCTEHFQDGTENNNGYSRYCSCYYSFADDSLKDYGMLVASYNNAAVENITKELPNAAAIVDGVAFKDGDADGIARGLASVQAVFDLGRAEMEVYQQWNKETGRFEPRQQPDIYFTGLAQRLAERIQGKEAKWWGLISAPFGKMSNIKNYISCVLRPYISSFGKTALIEAREAAYPQAAKRFLEQYNKVLAMEKELHKVSSARAEYLCQDKVQQQKCARLSSRLQSCKTEEQQLIRQILQLEAAIEVLARELPQVQATVVSQKAQVSGQQAHYDRCSQTAEDIKQSIITLEQSRKLWDYILELVKKPSMLSQEIRQKYALLEQAKQDMQGQEAALAAARQQLQKLEENARGVNEKVDAARSQCATIQNQQAQNLKNQQGLCQQIQDCRQTMEKLLADYRTLLQAAKDGPETERMQVLDADFMALYNSPDQLENCAAHVQNPWQTAEYDREREKLFYEALRLHKAFLLGSKCCLYNFKNLLLMWNEPQDDDKKTVRFSERDRKAAFGDLLNTVFLLTPVLSTTFASAGAMLSSIQKPGQIGCLIIDEAGQASPQMAVGALLRSRRAIVVGDPKQVEPVVTDELDLIKQIVRDDKTRYYQDKALSVQGFADRLNQIGTYYSDGEQKLWVGCPLVVHRRCISPMFDISNAISYDGMMRQQTLLPSAQKEATFCKPNSGWIQVCGSEVSGGKNHYVPEQGKKAWELIRHAFEKAEKAPSIFVITPFTSVRDGFKQMLSKQPEFRGNRVLQDWADSCIGTVHTFQGKEADQVIFLLGCDKNAIPAVRWVNANIINVAVTRAKYRLYVIGDYLVWQESHLMQQVKGLLDSYAIRTLRQLAQAPEGANNKALAEAMLRQMPDADSLTTDGQLDERLLMPMARELDRLLGQGTAVQWGEFSLTEGDVQRLPEDIRRSLTTGVLQHQIISAVQKRYELNLSDASGVGILFCKTLEGLLKDQLLDKFKGYFGSVQAYQSLVNRPADKATIGTFTKILGDAQCRSDLVQKNAVLAGIKCDDAWWSTYFVHLDNLRELRNHCCHSGAFPWEEYAQLLNLLFDQRTLMNTMVGSVLPA